MNRAGIVQREKVLARTRLEWKRFVAAVCCALAGTAAAAAGGTQAQAEDRTPARDEYSAARVAASTGDIERAERHLRAAVRGGFLDFSVMQRDAALTPLRGRPVMDALLAARDAADDLLAERRNADWTAQLGQTSYDATHDAARKIDLLIPVAGPGTTTSALDAVGATIDALRQRLFAISLRHRVLVVVLADEDAAVLLPHSHVHGKYVHSQRLILAADAGRALQHELAHALHHAHMDALGQQHPMWVQEGLASLFESMAAGGCSASAQHECAPYEIHRNERDSIIEMMVERGRTIAWRDFFALTAAEFERDGGSHYAQARSIMRFLHESGHLDSWYGELCASLGEDPSGARAMQRLFELPLGEIEQTWLRWVAASAASGPVLAARVAHSVEGPITPPPREELAADPRATINGLYERVRPRLLHEYRRAIPHLHEVISMDPAHAAARYDLGLALVFTGDIAGAEAERSALDRLDRNLASLLASAINAHN